jgi:hypothetical protein
MFKKHTYSPNHKVVAGPHNYSPPAPGGGPAGAPGGGMDASGGASANYADGGSVLDKARDFVSRKVFGADDYDPNSGRKPVTPLAAGGDSEKYVGKGGQESTDATLKKVDDMS